MSSDRATDPAGRAPNASDTDRGSAPTTGSDVAPTTGSDVAPTTGPRRKVVVLASGTGSLLQALIDASAGAGWRVAGLVCDQPQAYAVERARAAGVPTATVRLADFPDRAAWDRGVARAVGTFSPDLVVLAGFMRLLGDPFLTAFGGRTINTHPALLPSFPGAHGVRDALAHGVKVTGTSVIIVDAGVDSGPIVAQRAVEVLDTDDEAALHERIKVVERELLVEIVDAMITRGWQVDGRHVRLGLGDSTGDSIGD